MLKNVRDKCFMGHYLIIIIDIIIDPQMLSKWNRITEVYQDLSTKGLTKSEKGGEKKRKLL